MFATTLTRSGIDRLFVMMALRNAGREAMQSWVSAPLTGSQQTQPGRTGQVSQRQAKQCAEGNASTDADRMWGIQWASSDTNFPVSLQKPLQAHADPHEGTPQQYRDQQHLEFCPEL